MAKFQKGQSGNPAGKPRGAKDKRTALRELLRPHAEELVTRVVELAKMGDMSAMRICIDRIMPPVKEDPIQVALPKISGPEDCTRAQAAVLNAVTAGDMLPSEGQALASLIDSQRRAYETTELTRRLEEIEAHLKMKGAGYGQS